MRLAISTPCFGDTPSASVALGYHKSILSLKHDATFIELPESDATAVTMLGANHTNTDLVRARSRALYAAHTQGFDRLLFWDADVTGTHEQITSCIRGMMAGPDLVAAPYAKKRVMWDRIAAWMNERQPGIATADEVRAQAFGPVLHNLDTSGAIGPFAPCEYVPMGFTMISRALMNAIYASDLPAFRDLDGHVLIKAPFMLRIHDGILLSEDHSFGLTVREMGFPSWAYCGPGVPLQHVGSMVYG